METMQIVSCLELMANLFIFVHNGLKVINGLKVNNLKVIIQPPLKNGTLFLGYESLSKGYNVLNEFMFQSLMRFCCMQWLPTRFYGSLSVYSRPLPSEKIAPWQPS